MTKLPGGADELVIAQEAQVASSAEQDLESELSLETPEDAEARVASTMGLIVENNHVAEAAQLADAEAVKPRIAEIRQALGIASLEDSMAVEIEPNPAIEMYGESIQRNHEMIRKFLDSKAENLRRRTSGEISGVELDRLDAKIDEDIQFQRDDIDHLNGAIQQLRVQGKNQPASTPSGELSKDALFAETAATEGSSQNKLDVGEMFVDRINAAPDLRSLARFLGELGDITAPDGYVYKKEDTLRTIGFLKDSKDPNLQAVTNTHGLRDKVRKLLLLREIE